MRGAKGCTYTLCSRNSIQEAQEARCKRGTVQAEKLSSRENLDERSCPADQSCQEEKCQTERKCRADQSRAERGGPVETSEVAEIGQR